MKNSNYLRILILATCALVLPLLWLTAQYFPPFSSNRPVDVTVTPGQSLNDVASLLQSRGVLASSLAFRLDLAVEGDVLVLPGTYQFHAGESFSDIRRILSGGPNVVVIDARPGLTISEIVARVSSDISPKFAEELTHALTPTQTPSPFGGASLEGLIGSGTYEVRPGESATNLAKEMVHRFVTQAAAVGLTPSTVTEGLSAYQTIIAASIVEKEGYYAFNMPKVGRTILNRLRRGGGLQMDATVLYALHRDGGTVTPAMLRIDNPYNTYLHPGLTPTPICIVSSDALSAMLHAPPGPWLYFVVIDRAGHEAFSATFAEQLANEARARSAGL